jgi:hypothetical protein
MMEKKPQAGEFYRHFKKKMYQVITIARHSETGEELVIYQALYGDYSVYARPLSMFISEVDHVKYPQVTQQYRFERVDRNNLEVSCPQVTIKAETKNPTAPATVLKVQEEELEVADPRLLSFLDAETYKEKYEVLVELEKDMTDRLINDFAVIIDVVIPEGELSNRFEQLKQSIATMARYETSRLR